MTIYIANDVEAAGPRLGVHSILSWGACVVTRGFLTFQECVDCGYVFYTELKPTSKMYDMDAMKIGCSHLRCLEQMRTLDSCFDPTHKDFAPRKVLSYMEEVCEDSIDAHVRFNNWIKSLRSSEKEQIVGITDTVFFDGGYINLLLGDSDFESPYGHGGLDLDSVYRGHTGRSNASLKELGVPDIREKPHRADHDAVLLAQQARELLFVKMGWR